MARATWWCCWPRWACCSTSPPAGAGVSARSGRRPGREPTRVPTRIVIAAGGTASHVMLTSRALAPFARRVCLAVPVEGRRGRRYLVTGRPVSPPATDRAAARERFGIGEDETCVLVFGGSLGARSINEAALAAFAEAPFRVIHVAGARGYPELRDRARSPRY